MPVRASRSDSTAIASVSSVQRGANLGCFVRLQASVGHSACDENRKRPDGCDNDDDYRRQVFSDADPHMRLSPVGSTGLRPPDAIRLPPNEVSASPGLHSSA